MRLALLGKNIAHSLSPSLYREMLGEKLESYELLDFPDSGAIPALSDLALRLDGLSITAPYKKHFLGQVNIDSEEVKLVGAINTISFRDGKFRATNTDVLATETILRRFQKQIPGLNIVLLGDGSMARMTTILATKLSIPVRQFSRKTGATLETLDLSRYSTLESQSIVINSCSRDFIFKGKLSNHTIFWDYNYNFTPHQTLIPQQDALYYDGQEMLRLQAEAALAFWQEKNP